MILIFQFYLIFLYQIIKNDVTLHNPLNCISYKSKPEKHSVKLNSQSLGNLMLVTAFLTLFFLETIFPTKLGNQQEKSLQNKSITLHEKFKLWTSLIRQEFEVLLLWLNLGLGMKNASLRDI